MENNIILEAKSISKSFLNPVKVDVLKDVSFSLSRGEYASIIGKSGSGKSLSSIFFPPWIQTLQETLL